LRKEWDLGYDPIPDVVEMLEDKGYKVVEIEAPNSFDGLKADTGTQKVIVLRKSSLILIAPINRQRYLFCTLK
jgi:hypothetical protein